MNKLTLLMKEYLLAATPLYPVLIDFVLEYGLFCQLEREPHDDRLHGYENTINIGMNSYRPWCIDGSCRYHSTPKTVKKIWLVGVKCPICRMVVAALLKDHCTVCICGNVCVYATADLSNQSDPSTVFWTYRTEEPTAHLYHRSYSIESESKNNKSWRQSRKRRREERRQRLQEE